MCALEHDQSTLTRTSYDSLPYKFGGTQRTQALQRPKVMLIYFSMLFHTTNIFVSSNRNLRENVCKMAMLMFEKNEFRITDSNVF